MNGDGINDLIIGEYGPNVYLFKRNADGTLAAGIALEDATGNKKLNEARFSAPVITDWNNDGLLDLVLGISNRGYTPEGYDSSGVIKLYINEGTKQAYKFVYKGLLTTGTGVLIRDDYMRLQSGDLNNDGKSDLVASNGYRTPPYCFNYYENTGTIESPKLASALMLKKTNGQLIDAEYYIFFCLTDWNKDGITDIIYQGNPASDDMYLCIGTMANQTLPSQNSANWGKQNIKLSSDGNRIILTAGKYPFLKKVTILTVTGRIIMVIPEVTSTAYVSIPVSLSRGVYVVRGQSATQTMESWIIITQ